MVLSACRGRFQGTQLLVQAVAMAHFLQHQKQRLCVPSGLHRGQNDAQCRKSMRHLHGAWTGQMPAEQPDSGTSGSLQTGFSRYCDMDWRLQHLWKLWNRVFDTASPHPGAYRHRPFTGHMGQNGRKRSQTSGFSTARRNGSAIVHAAAKAEAEGASLLCSHSRSLVYWYCQDLLAQWIGDKVSD